MLKTARMPNIRMFKRSMSMFCYSSFSSFSSSNESDLIKTFDSNWIGVMRRTQMDATKEQHARELVHMRSMNDDMRVRTEAAEVQARLKVSENETLVQENESQSDEIKSLSSKVAEMEQKIAEMHALMEPLESDASAAPLRILDGETDLNLVSSLVIGQDGRVHPPRLPLSARLFSRTEEPLSPQSQLSATPSGSQRAGDDDTDAFSTDDLASSRSLKASPKGRKRIGSSRKMRTPKSSKGRRMTIVCFHQCTIVWMLISL
jgi:hypothetical protein